MRGQDQSVFVEGRAEIFLLRLLRVQISYRLYMHM